MADYITPADGGWTPCSNPTQTRLAFETAIEMAIDQGVEFVALGNYTLRGGLTPSAPVLWRVYGTWTFETGGLNFDTDGITIYPKIMALPPISAEYPANVPLVFSGVYTAIDTRNMARSVISGQLCLAAQGVNGTPPVASMRSTERNRLVKNFAAINCTQGLGSSEISIEKLWIQSFGRGIFQGDMRGAVARGQPPVLGQTRNLIGETLMRFVEVPFESGQSGNGFDDAIWSIVRIQRCGTSYIVNTDWTGHSLFDGGMLASADMEITGFDANDDPIPLKITCAAGSTAATLDEQHPSLAVGDVIAISEGGRNKAGGAIGFVTSVVAVSGTSVTLGDAPEAAINGASFVMNPPAVELLAGGSMTFAHHYIENVHDMGVRLDAAAKYVCDDFKISRATCTCRRGTPLLTTALDCAVDIALNPRSVNNDSIRALIGFSPLRLSDNESSQNGSDSRIAARILVKDRYDYATISSDLFTSVKIPEDLRFGKYLSRHANTIRNINVVADCADAPYRFIHPGNVTGPGGSSTGNGTYAWRETVVTGLVSGLVSGNAAPIYDLSSLPVNGRLSIVVQSPTDPLVHSATGEVTRLGDTVFSLRTDSSSGGGTFSRVGTSLEYSKTGLGGATASVYTQRLG